MSASIEQALKQHFQLSHFRPGQREIIAAILEKKDVLAVLPTGGGKSLCYQLPALLLEKLVVVVSPLIALMKDQVAALQRIGVPAGAIYSGQSLNEKRDIFEQIRRGGAFVLYLSPERVQKQGFQSWIRTQSLALFAVDEAHCVSQWGHDFREEYAQLHILKTLRPEVPTLALTASATPTVLLDIAKQLRLHKPERRVHGFYRPNLYFQVENCADEEAKLALLLQGLRKFREGRVLIYCGTRRVTEELSSYLGEQFAQVGHYHAGLTATERTHIQESYTRGDLRILVATNAFVMGIDQPDVRLVVHFHMPANIDSLYQEMGRAGRDGKDSTCLMLYAPKDKGLQSYFIQSSEANQEIKNSRWRNLEALVNYSETGECRHGEILTYYRDEKRLRNCNHCDNCLPQSPRRIEGSALPMAVTLKGRDKTPKIKLRKKKTATDLELNLDSAQENLFQALRRWRKEKALALDAPAFTVFSDKTLKHLALANPLSKKQLSNIYGIGEEKLARYGDEVIAIIENEQ